MSDTPRIAFLASTAEPAQMARAAMISRYGDHAPEQADVLCPLGGDGFMLQTLHRHGHLGKPVFGMNLAGQVLGTKGSSAEAKVAAWMGRDDNSLRFTLAMLAELAEQKTLDYPTVSVAVQRLGQ
ncbi:TPA: hypothetical protein ACOECV_004353, partial [Stenotrophomonas maltophilia]